MEEGHKCTYFKFRENAVKVFMRYISIMIGRYSTDNKYNNFVIRSKFYVDSMHWQLLLKQKLH